MGQVLEKYKQQGTRMVWMDWSCSVWIISPCASLSSRIGRSCSIFSKGTLRSQSEEWCDPMGGLEAASMDLRLGKVWCGFSGLEVELQIYFVELQIYFFGLKFKLYFVCFSLFLCKLTFIDDSQLTFLF